MLALPIAARKPARMHSLDWLIILGTAGIGGLAFLRIISNGRSGVLMARQLQIEAALAERATAGDDRQSVASEPSGAEKTQSSRADDATLRGSAKGARNSQKNGPT